ncbi:DUF1427 family protein [Streptomyces sp. NPDC002306]
MRSESKIWLRSFFLSLAVGVLAGLLYWAMGVRSPAPPWIAFIGLLGILIGQGATRRLLGHLRKRRSATAEHSEAGP